MSDTDTENQKSEIDFGEFRERANSKSIRFNNWIPDKDDNRAFNAIFCKSNNYCDCHMAAYKGICDGDFINTWGGNII